MSFDDVWTSISDSFVDLAGRTADYIPRFLGALAVLIIGLIVARVLANIVGRVVDFIEENKYYEKMMNQARLKITLSAILSKLTYWVVLVIFLSTVVDLLGLSVLTDTFNAIIGYIPTALAAAVVVGVAVWGGRVLQDLVTTAVEGSKIDHRYNNILGTITYVAVLVFGLTIAMGTLGFNTLILTTNVSIIIAGFVLALAIAFGFGSKTVAGSLVSGLYSKKHVKKGQRIAVGDVRGTVTDISATAVTVETKDGDVIVPFSRIMQ